MPVKKHSSSKAVKSVSFETVVKAVVTHKRLKQPGNRVSELLQLANLVPPGAVLPKEILPMIHFPKYLELVTAVNRLPQPLREHLREVFTRNSDRELFWAGAGVSAARDGQLNISRSVKQAMQIRAVIKRYNEIREARELLDQIMRLIQDEEVGLIRQCKLCRKTFFAGRSDQFGCPLVCNKKLRHQRWLAGKGRDYRPTQRQTQQPRHLARVKRKLETWPSPPFLRTEDNLMRLAAYADVTLKECQAAIDYIQSEKDKPKQKRKA